MRVIMTAGGTGGHLYPAIAIAEKIKEKNPEAEILFVGTHRALEKEMLEPYGYKHIAIASEGLYRKNVLKNFGSLRKNLKGYGEAKALIRKFKPDYVIGTGGYVTGVMIYAAKKLGVKTAIHEQNVVPGLTNKWLSKIADKTFVSFEQTKSKFDTKKEIVLSGNPIRSAFFNTSYEESRKSLGIGAEEFVILAYGGSQGSKKLNQVLMKGLKIMDQVKDVKIFFVTGKAYFEEVKNYLGKNTEAIELLPFTDIMHQYVIGADFIISRAGAISMSEFTACGKATLLIPSPNVTNNHQYYNAKELADFGGAFLLTEDAFNEESLMELVQKVATDRRILKMMEDRSKDFGTRDAAEIIYKALF